MLGGLGEGVVMAVLFCGVISMGGTWARECNGECKGWMGC